MNIRKIISKVSLWVWSQFISFHPHSSSQLWLSITVHCCRLRVLKHKIALLPATLMRLYQEGNYKRWSCIWGYGGSKLDYSNCWADLMQRNLFSSQEPYCTEQCSEMKRAACHQVTNASHYHCGEHALTQAIPILKWEWLNWIIGMYIGKHNHTYVFCADRHK